MKHTNIGSELQGSDPLVRVEAARVMGQATTEAKARAARENGCKGGRPKGIPMSDDTKRKISEARKRVASASRSRPCGNQPSPSMLPPSGQ